MAARRNIAPIFDFGVGASFGRVFNGFKNPEVKVFAVYRNACNEFVGAFLVKKNATHSRLAALARQDVPHVFLVSRYAQIAASIIKGVAVDMIYSHPSWGVFHYNAVQDKRFSILGPAKGFFDCIYKVVRGWLNDCLPSKIGEMRVFIVNDCLVASAKIDCNHGGSVFAVSHRVKCGRVENR